MTHATLIANAGILLEIDGIRFLIDGLHHSSQYPFSPVPQAMLDQMLRGEGTRIFCCSPMTIRITGRLL